MQNCFELNVHLAFDEETSRWYIAESDIPGLWLEDADPLELIRKIEDAAPEMIELNQEEIITECMRKASQGMEPMRKHVAKIPSAAIRPVFDSPLRLAHAI